MGFAALAEFGGGICLNGTGMPGVNCALQEDTWGVTLLTEGCCRHRICALAMWQGVSQLKCSVRFGVRDVISQLGLTTAVWRVTSCADATDVSSAS